MREGGGCYETTSFANFGAGYIVYCRIRFGFANRAEPGGNQKIISLPFSLPLFLSLADRKSTRLNSSHL